MRRVDIVPAHLIPKYLQEFYRYNSNFTVAFHNAPFDLDVLKLREDYNAPLLKAVQDGRVVDTGVRYILREMFMGRMPHKWRLDLVVWNLLKIALPKDDDVRLSFRPGMVLSQAQLEYAAKDPAATALLLEAMPEALPTEHLQTIGYIALSDIGRRGMFVDRDYMSRLRQEFVDKKLVNDEVLSIYGYYPGESGNQTVLQTLLSHIEGSLQMLDNDPSKKFRRTKKKKEIQLTDESLVILGSREHPLIKAYKDSEHQGKIISTYLNEGLVHVDNAVHPSFTPLVKTGRTSCRGPNMQNLPRKENVRGIYIPRPGYLLYAADYSQLELCALAQSCYTVYGRSTMREVINDGVDLHTWFASIVLNKDIKDVTKADRQMAKACYSRDTELLTPSGWVRIDEVYNTDTPVMQHNPETGEMSFTTALDWVHKKDQRLIRFENDYTDTLVTPDHRVICNQIWLCTRKPGRRSYS